MKHAKTPHQETPPQSHASQSTSAPKQSAILAQKPTPANTPMLCDCVEFLYIGTETYPLRLTSGKVFDLTQGQRFIIPEGTLSRWCSYKSTLFTKA